MAEFSKQYLEIADFDLPIDFDIEEMAEGLKYGHYLSIICEGWGFDAIGKDEEGSIILHFTDYEQQGVQESGRGRWVDYVQALEELRELIKSLGRR